MIPAFPQASSARRSGLLAVVVGAHAGALLLLLAAKTLAPQIAEAPLLVDLLPPGEPTIESKPLPPLKPQTIRRQPAPITPAPLIEATTGVLPAPAAPLAASPEFRQPPPVAAVEPLIQARFDADYLRNPAPAYPAPSRRLGEEGKVVLRVLVSPQGMAEAVELKSASGSPRLDDAALNTVKNWRFSPARRGETPVQSWVLVPIIFKLEQ